MTVRTPSFYNLAWRWHFYAGLFVIPFMILLSLTGIVYLFKPQLDQLMYPELLSVQPAGTPLSADQTVKERKDGSLYITATVVDSLLLMQWLRGFGDAVSNVRKKKLP